MSKLALILSLVAVGLGIFALLGKDDTAQGAATLALSNADIDAVARRLQEEVQRAAQTRDQAAQREMDQRLKKLQDLLNLATEMLQKAQARAESTANFNAGKLEELDAMVATVNTGVDKQASALEQIEKRIKALEERPIAVAGPAPAPGPKPGPGSPIPAAPLPGPPKPELPSGPPEDPAVVKAQVEKALADLDSEDPDKLYPAITVVAKRKAMEAVPKLVKVLGTHAEFFTRQAAASALGDLKACDAVPALADALRDKSTMVAQQANKSLRLITEHDLGLSPQARPQERTRARQDMLEWWARHETEVRERLKQPK
jgi:hypothetical protein